MATRTCIQLFAVMFDQVGAIGQPKCTDANETTTFCTTFRVIGLTLQRPPIGSHKETTTMQSLCFRRNCAQCGRRTSQTSLQPADPASPQRLTGDRLSRHNV